MPKYTRADIQETMAAFSGSDLDGPERNTFRYEIP